MPNPSKLVPLRLLDIDIEDAPNIAKLVNKSGRCCYALSNEPSNKLGRSLVYGLSLRFKKRSI